MINNGKIWGGGLQPQSPMGSVTYVQIAIAQGCVDIKAKLSFPNSPKFNAKIINLYGNIVVYN